MHESVSPQWYWNRFSLFNTNRYIVLHVHLRYHIFNLRTLHSFVFLPVPFTHLLHVSHLTSLHATSSTVLFLFCFSLQIPCSFFLPFFLLPHWKASFVLPDSTVFLTTALREKPHKPPNHPNKTEKEKPRNTAHSSFSLQLHHPSALDTPVPFHLCMLLTCQRGESPGYRDKAINLITLSQKGYRKLCNTTSTAQGKAVEPDLGQHWFYNLICNESTMERTWFLVSVPCGFLNPPSTGCHWQTEIPDLGAACGSVATKQK